jgi:hypothetical protein
MIATKIINSINTLSDNLKTGFREMIAPSRVSDNNLITEIKREFGNALAELLT